MGHLSSILRFFIISLTFYRLSLYGVFLRVLLILKLKNILSWLRTGYADDYNNRIATTKNTDEQYNHLRATIQCFCWSAFCLYTYIYVSILNIKICFYQIFQIFNYSECYRLQLNRIKILFPFLWEGLLKGGKKKNI
jgi:hypothetical protein